MTNIILVPSVKLFGIIRFMLSLEKFFKYFNLVSMSYLLMNDNISVNREQTREIKMKDNYCPQFYHFMRLFM